MSILPVAETTFAVQAPVVIIGGGACGLAAALAAQDAGAAPLVLEQSAACLGSSSMSLGAVCAAGTAEQKRHGENDNAAAFYDDIMAKTGGAADPVLAMAIAQESGPALDWLATRHDVAFGFESGWGAGFGHSCARMHSTPGRSGADMMSRLVAACDRVGVDIVNNARVTDLFADQDGRVHGVRAVRPDGSVEDIGCEALILASCGFGGNHAMIAENIPSMKDARYFGWEGNHGDAMTWGRGLGAALANMNAYQGLGLLADPQGIDVNPKFLLEGGIQVNALGERFSNEVDDVSGQGARVIAQPGGFSWLIYDERIHQICASLPQYVSLLELNSRRSGDDLQELAERTGLPVAALAGELGAIDIAMARAEPDRFGRRFAPPALTGPFHALRVTGAVFHTLGGLVVDEQARVQRPDGSPLPNLFAGGGAARGFSGDGPSGYLPGAGLCAALTLGRVAGRVAAAQTQST
jgi:fumarate reductase flavoprotein subunit